MTAQPSQDWRQSVKVEVRQQMIQDMYGHVARACCADLLASINALSKGTKKDPVEIRDTASKLELKSLQDAQNYTEYQNNVRTRTMQVVHTPAVPMYPTTITQPPPSLPAGRSP